MDDGENLVRDGYRRVTLSIVIIGTFRRLIIVSRKLSGKVVVASSRIQIGPESQTNSFWGILYHKSLEINESPL